jgi:hypothetical protein
MVADGARLLSLRCLKKTTFSRGESRVLKKEAGGSRRSTTAVERTERRWRRMICEEKASEAVMEVEEALKLMSERQMSETRSYG